MQDAAQRFLTPENSTHRRYEALRALFVDKLSIDEAAGRFGYAPGALRNLRAEFLRQPERPFFLPDRRGRSKPRAGPDRDRLIVELRKGRNLSAAEIAAHLAAQDNIRVSETTVARVLKRAGLPKLWRRTADQRTGSARPERAAIANRAELDLGSRRFRTGFGGLFLFAPDLARLDLDGILRRGDMPGGRMIPPGCAVRSLLALKLWGIGRPSHVSAEVLDEGLALFAGLNAIPKRSTLTEYSCRVDPRFTPELMDDWHRAVAGLGVDLGGGRSFDLDFHTIPYHGDDALIEKHYVSKRSRRQKGVLAFLVRDADAHLFAYANAKLRKDEQNDEILRFIEAWRARTGERPGELVFDSRLTTHANLGKLDAMGIAFLTLRRRSSKMVAELLAEPPGRWRRITLKNISRAYRNPRILEQEIDLKTYPAKIRQIAITDLGHEKPTLLLTNQMTEPAANLIDRYARRMVIENIIADAIDFFHMDALSAAVPLRVNVDVQLTLMASALYRLLANRAGRGMEAAKAQTIFRKLVHASATVEITADEIIVSLGRRANNPLLIAAGYGDIAQKIPWLGDRTLRFRFF